MLPPVKTTTSLRNSAAMSDGAGNVFLDRGFTFRSMVAIPAAHFVLGSMLEIGLIMSRVSVLA